MMYSCVEHSHVHLHQGAGIYNPQAPTSNDTEISEAKATITLGRKHDLQRNLPTRPGQLWYDNYVTCPCYNYSTYPC